MTVAEVRLWGRTIGAVSWDADRDVAFFEYDPAFRGSGIQLAPLTMPLSSEIYAFPELPRETFYGLPGLLADSLPDRFGNALIDAWLAAEGRSGGSLNAVERLCYTGHRGMGALEFEPVEGPSHRGSRSIDVAALVSLASEILSQREGLAVSFDGAGRSRALADILRVGTSAGGARAKAVIAWNPDTEEVRSGQVEAGDGFSAWILKFDGVAGNRDKELDDAQGYGLIEYAYHKMAVAAGIEMSECRILQEGGRHHFMTKRFDRGAAGEKIHMQTLGAMAHYDFNHVGAHAYEQALQVMQRLALPMRSKEQQFRRMVFNVVARNQDDHVKNIAYLMDRAGSWSLAPAYDVMYSYNPDGHWTGQHQMSLNGKRDRFEVDDFVACAKTASLKRGRARAILDEVREVVRGWPRFAEQAGVPPRRAQQIAATHRVELDARGLLG
ncbi:MAG: type II toxin-antitoxin system HipA family toxin [Deltaproteobacteria bacterium]|nr:type II toxin-antitoxin system HipA family toxin [Deltaproteobacteria bacterium]